MASAVVKMAVVCLLLLSAGHLMASAAAARPDTVDDAAALLRLKDRIELQEEEALALAEELALLDDGAGDAVGAGCSCSTTKCMTCIATCGIKCFPKGIKGFPTCFFACVFTTSKCFAFGA